MPTELGAHHQRLTAVAALQARKDGWGAGRFAIEGPTLLEEALGAGLALEELYATPAALLKLPRLAELERAGTPLFEIGDRPMRRISDLDSPPGLVAVVSHPPTPVDRLLEGEEPVLALAVGDPGNAGTLLRSALAFGVRGVVFGRGGVDPYHPKVVRAAMGALFRLAIGVADGPALLEAASAAGRPVISLDLDGEPLEGFGFPARPVFAVGHERHGVRAWLPSRDRAVRIPVAGIDSLNAAVAGSIVLYRYMVARGGS